MITKIHIRGYRIFDDIVLEPNDGMNIIVGGNGAGKSTLVEAVMMTLTGKFEGLNAIEALNPYWFNNNSVNSFFDKLAATPGGVPLPAFPEFRIDVHLNTSEGHLQKMRGVNNMLREDSVGLTIHAYPDLDYTEDLDHYFRSENCPRILPVEYYRLEWRDFADQVVFRRPKDLGVSVIDTRTIRSDKGMDYYTRQLVEKHLDLKIRNQVSVEHRKQRANLGADLLDILNQAIDTNLTTDGKLKIGIQVDQSRSTSWANTLIPSIDEVPFTQSGKGTQAITKTILATTRAADTSNYLFIEEPENHLSHTRLRELLALISDTRRNRQSFITTHSSYVLNRLGLDQLILLQNGSPHTFNELSKETSEYFQRLSGFDTLRLVLANQIVIVEGPSDEILFNRFFTDSYGAEPLDFGIDVMSGGGVSYKRGFELAHVLNRPLIALRDCDGMPEGYWEERVKAFTKPNERQLFVGDAMHGDTLEHQLCSMNEEDSIRQALSIGPDINPLDWMLAHKTDAALRIAKSPVSLNPPTYFVKAFDALKVPTNSNNGIS